MGPGQKFIGTCVLCGETGLTSGDALKPCPNQRGVTQDEALLEAIEGGDAALKAAEAG